LEVAKAAVHVVQSQKAEEEEGFNEFKRNAEMSKQDMDALII
jgi:hypothetical protein